MLFNIEGLLSSPWFLPGIFVLGIFSGFYSCSLLEVPFLASMVSVSVKNKKEAFIKALAFVLGLVVSYVFIGLFFSQVAKVFAKFLGLSFWLFFLIGIIGVLWGGKIIFEAGKYKHCSCSSGHCDLKKNHQSKDIKDSFLQKIKPTGLINIFFIGAVFAWLETPICPCCGPVLYSLAALTVAKGQVLFGMITFFLYSFGQGIPVIMLTVFLSHVMRDSLYEKSRVYFEVLLGNILFFVGLVFLWLA